MAEQNSNLVQIRVTKEQRETLRMLKTGGQNYADALSTVMEQDPEEYRAIAEIAEQKV
ncbi:hypothetical protein [Haloarcula sp. CGMCC 1.2071]|uniref:hypothetical protein n=1 Tax=Haloarcula sp. CGMCC 1.2071 TaxID=3111454 RepID=UPI00300F0D78